MVKYLRADQAGAVHRFTVADSTNLAQALLTVVSEEAGSSCISIRNIYFIKIISATQSKSPEHKNL
jgi:hypothetical protein